jgi:hypothetical protein
VSIRKTRLGWAEESRARVEAKRLHPDATIRQFADLSWATCTPAGEVRGRFGLIGPHEQVWRTHSKLGRALGSAMASLGDPELAPASPKRTRFEIPVTLVLTDEQLRDVARAVRGRKTVRRPADLDELRNWVTAELAVSLAALQSEEP